MDTGIETAARRLSCHQMQIALPEYPSESLAGIYSEPWIPSTPTAPSTTDSIASSSPSEDEGELRVRKASYSSLYIDPVRLSDLSDQKNDSPREDDSPLSSGGSVSHLFQWSERSETLIIFDWDDTVCPTSYANDHPLEELGQAWDDHERMVTELFRIASALGHVVIVTMAFPEWIKESINRLMPSLAGVLNELEIEIISVRSGLSKSARAAAFGECRNPTQFVKTRAMKRVVRRFYRRRGERNTSKSWKNIVGVGDSPAERFALQDVVFNHVQCDRKGRTKDCRCKTVRLLDSPSLEQLTTELQVLVHWLPTMVHHDGDLDLDFASDDLMPLDDEPSASRRRSV